MIRAQPKRLPGYGHSARNADNLNADVLIGGAGHPRILQKGQITLEDRLITISTGRSRQDKEWKNNELRVSELFDRLKEPVTGSETHAEYMRMDKTQRAPLKDVGGFVGGSLKGKRRKTLDVIGRDLVTLDFDHISNADSMNVLLDHVRAIGCCYAVYSTRSHHPDTPRLRVVIPTDKTMTPDEYEPVSRKVAEWIGMEMADTSTFDINRLMYWPSCCSDVPLFYEADTVKPLISVEQVLSHYSDWSDPAQWPGVNLYDKHCNNKKQEDPETKKGVVGAFCRAYDVYRAISELIPDAYSAVDNAEDRFTYTGGSTAGGAVIHDGGKFLYSHHATDPCSGRLVNAFDLVRLHKFGEMDMDTDDNATGTKLPSYTAMIEFALSLDEVRLDLVHESENQRIADFQSVVNEEKWGTHLELDGKGKIKATIKNYGLYLGHHHELKDRIYYDDLELRIKGIAPLPWGNRVSEKEGMTFAWSDADAAGLRGFFQKIIETGSKNNLDDAFIVHAMEHHQDKVRNYLNSLVWDGVPRLDTLFVDYLGAADSDYTRAVTRKAFVAAVARAMEPGVKFDCMLVLSGKQGCGKSTILRKMSRGFFNDSIRTFEGKEASELLQGAWIVEIAELGAFRKSDVERIKQFLSQCDDQYRAAYGRYKGYYPRRCVFFGTTNSSEYLQDMTGGRRFWPVDVCVIPAVKSVFEDLTDDVIAQVWAEAKARWVSGERLFLTGELEEAAQAQQEAHRETDPWEPIIIGWLEKPIPKDWNKWDAVRRQMFWSGNASNVTDLVERESVRVVEIVAEIGHILHAQLDTTTSRRIGGILKKHGWVHQTSRKHPLYGPSRPFIKSA